MSRCPHCGCNCSETDPNITDCHALICRLCGHRWSRGNETRERTEGSQENSSTYDLIVDEDKYGMNKAKRIITRYQLISSRWFT